MRPLEVRECRLLTQVGHLAPSTPIYGLHGKDSLAGTYGRPIPEPQYVSSDRHPETVLVHICRAVRMACFREQPVLKLFIRTRLTQPIVLAF